MSENESNPHRIRTITWEDPRVSARDAASIGGLDYLRAIKDGKVKPPPVAALIGYQLLEIDVGRVVFELEPAEYHYNPFATMHGGIMSTVLDSAMTSAILTTLPAGVGCSTLEIKVNFVRPITDRTGLVRCEGKIIHGGNRIAIAEGRITDSRDKLCAFAVSTCMVFRVEQEP
jgi:uncharacterized protein (TIGR00369 family)